MYIINNIRTHTQRTFKHSKYLHSTVLMALCGSRIICERSIWRKVSWLASFVSIFYLFWLHFRTAHAIPSEPKIRWKSFTRKVPFRTEMAERNYHRALNISYSLGNIVNVRAIAYWIFVLCRWHFFFSIIKTRIDFICTESHMERHLCLIHILLFFFFFFCFFLLLAFFLRCVVQCKILTNGNKVLFIVCCALRVCNQKRMCNVHSNAFDGGKKA